ncbi:hypothetical protein JD844_019742 [Phrynosoma platyrhinos]|uniref:SANT domain-containing protein n=1 Tax=Phrynosoma platyrhinos TaxID=52577 RepID=A0ABQ7TPX6_PHRPL|nr:hypothetical protein JD844_019742 [Phrynosoma platyrhinos]
MRRLARVPRGGRGFVAGPVGLCLSPPQSEGKASRKRKQSVAASGEGEEESAPTGEAGEEALGALRGLGPSPEAPRVRRHGASMPQRHELTWLFYRMTVKLGESSTSNTSSTTEEEGLRKLGKRAGEEGSLGQEGSLEEGTGGGGAGQAAPSSSSSTKKEEEATFQSNTNGEPALAGPALLQAPSSAQPTHNQDQHHFLRSSVRPQSKRFRKDSQASCGDNSGTSSGSSSGILPSTPASSSKSAARNLTSSAGEKEEGKKVRRQWESWSTEDKNTFFEGLYEHGKDFEAIQNNIALKYKKKSKPASMVKNKEQVRHFYYRTWHKISKYIDFDNGMDDKNAAKLNELIQVGATTVRYKGRNLRIKAPMCRALKKLCDPDGMMIVELHRKVSSLIEFLKQKWALHEVRIRKTLAERQLQDSRNCEANNSYSEEKVMLHLFPGENCTLTPLPGVARVVHSKAFCTVHWQESGRCKQNAKDSHLLPPAQILGIQSGQGTARGHVKYPRGAEGKGGTRVESTTEASRNTQSTLDATLNAEDCSLESGLLEKSSPSLSVTNCFDKSLSGLQDPGRCLEKSVAPVHCVEGKGMPVSALASSFSSDSTNCDCGSLPPDIEELSLLDPFPRYMKSCQDLIVPEKCLCTDTLNGKEVALPRSNSGKLLSGISEADSCSPTQLARGRMVSLSGLSVSETQALHCSVPQAEICAKELPDSVTEDSQEKLNPSLPLPPSQEQLVTKSLKDDPSRLAQQVREEGWSLRTSESLTLAEVYLMMGKPNKLQLEYDWLAVLGPETQESREQMPKPTSVPPPATCHKQKLLSCLLKLISTEVNPKPNTWICGQCLRNSSRPLLVADPSSSGSADTDRSLFAVPTTLPPNSRHGKLFLQSKEAELSFRQRLDTISRMSPKYATGAQILDFLVSLSSCCPSLRLGITLEPYHITSNGLMQSDFFLPKPRKLRSRHLRKPLVVQRTLLPRPSGNPSQHVCSFSILSNSSVTGAIDLAAKSAGIIPGSPLPVLGTDGLSGGSPLSPGAVTAVVAGPDSTVAHQNESSITNIADSSSECRVPFLGLPTQPEQEAIPDGFQGTPSLAVPELSKISVPNGLSTPSLPSEGSSACLSPPNVSALLDISLPGPPEDVLSQGEPVTQISDSIIEIAISSGQYGENVPLSPAKLNGSDSSKSLPSPSCSPQQNWIASPTHDPQWYPSDSTDSSLSSLFSSFLSPEKGRKMLPTSAANTSSTTLLGPSLLDGNSRDSFVSRSLADVAEVVDSQLACMMNENSIDYISRFNDLAQELSIPEPARREILFDGGGGGPPIGDLSQ